MTNQPNRKGKRRDFTFLLKCPDIHNAPTVVTAVVEETLIDLILNGESPKDWNNELWYYDNLQNRLFDEDGEICLIAQGNELWDFMKDPAHGRVMYNEQIRQHLHNFRVSNETYLHAVRDQYELEHLTVIRAFKNQWLLLAEGVKKT